MAITFDIGDPGRPRGHAIAYFRSGTELLATYLLVLPIAMDVGKYLPPLLASQLGGIAGDLMGGGIGSFAAPPVPERVESLAYLESLARLRGDDLISGGEISAGDIAIAMQEAAAAVQEYSRLYEQRPDSVEDPGTEPAAVEAGAGPRVEHVLYELMSDRDKLGELSKLVGTMRFATERGDSALAGETDASIEALERLLPEHYWTGRVRTAAGDTSEAGARLSQLYVERCYKLLEEDFTTVAEIERKISELSA